uniref:ABC-type xenobiotic transporter n=1 Tax=Mesocestoides corti TaxID=53468 RepID=A0A5K3F1U0_MESCO
MSDVSFLQPFCGNLSSDFWEGGKIGFCFSEAFLHTPVAIILSIILVVHAIRMIPSLVFEWPLAKIIVIRIFLDLAVITKCLLTISFCLSPFLISITVSPFMFSSHLGSAMVCITCRTLFDFILGKTNLMHSRGPSLVLFAEVLYFYTTCLQLWSGLSQLPFSSHGVFLVGLLFDSIAFGCHLLTKVPVIFPVENERIQRARLIRNVNNAVPDQSSNILDISNQYQSRSESSVGCLGKLLFTWINETISKGFYGELSSTKFLPPLPASLCTTTLEFALDADLLPTTTNSKFKSAFPLVKQLFTKFGREITVLGCIKFVFSVLTLSSPVILNKFIEELTDFQANWRLAALWGAALVASRLVTIFLDISYSYWTARFGLKTKISITCLVYRQLLRHKMSTLSEFSTGNLVNLLTSDTERIVNLTPSLNEVWAMPVQVIVAIWLLYYQVGFSCFVGVAFLVVLLPLNKLLTNYIGKYSSALMHHKDLRVKILSEVLQSMTTIKLACWEFLMRRKILSSRHFELNALRGQKLLDAACVFLWAACPSILAGSTFATYVALGNTLRPAKVFTSLALFNMLIGPMNAFPWVLNGVVEALISAGRICRLFRINTDALGSTNSAFNTDNMPIGYPQTRDDLEVNLTASSFYWTSMTTPTLTDITLTVPKGQLVGIVGPVACGKSSLLLALMGELQTVNFQDSSTGARFAYVGLKPWLQQGTILSNILFGKSLEPDWLSAVVDACGLTEDLSEMPAGLDTEVGEAGSCLSGGQKARVALARAIYQRADVYLFDDPLAALDSCVASGIIKKCIGRQGLLAGKTRFIATHLPDWLFSEDENFGGPADLVITLSEGRIVSRWTPGNKLGSSADEQQNHSVPHSRQYSTPDYMSEEDRENESDSKPLLPATQEETRTGVKPIKDEDASNLESFAFGSIASRVYRWYIRSVGYCLALCVLISLMLMQVSRNGLDYWLSYWMQNGSPSPSNLTSPSVEYIGAHSLPLIGALYTPPVVETLTVGPPTINSTNFYLSVYASIIGANLLFTIFRSVLFAYAGLAAAATIHERMLDTVLQGEMHFFDVTPLGRILNRFSSDVGTIDDGLPFLLNIFLAVVFGLLGALVVTCLAMPAILVIFLPLLFVYWSVQRVYRAAARDLKRLSRRVYKWCNPCHVVCQFPITSKFVCQS